MEFKKIFDAIFKSKILLGIYQEVEKMHLECQKMFEESFESLIKNNDELARRLIREDLEINRLEIKIRKEILGYLAVNTAPNLNSALILVVTVSNYERIGDYAKGIARLALSYPSEFKKNGYPKRIFEIKNLISKEFEIVFMAFKNQDLEKAKEVIEIYKKIRKIEEGIVADLNQEKKLKINTAITYALLSTYLRRIGAHLKNIATGIIRPFPLIDFEKQE